VTEVSPKDTFEEVTMEGFGIVRRVTTVCAVLMILFGASVLRAEDILRFAVFSDSRSDGRPTDTCTQVDFGVGKSLAPVVESVLKKHAESPIRLILFPGDMIRGLYPYCGTTVAESNRSQLQYWRRIMAPLMDAGVEIRVTTGNHEAIASDPNIPGIKCSKHTWPYRPSLDNYRVLKEVLKDMMGPDTVPGSDLGFTYSFDEGDVHFVMLDAYTPYRRDAFSEKIILWLEEDLKTAKEAGKRIFVASHPPAFPGGGHMWEGLPFYDPGYLCENRSGIDMRKERDRFWKILQRFGVIAYFCGHEHNIQVQQVRGVWHVVSGGVTPDLYPLNGSEKDHRRNTLLYDGKFQNPEATEIWPWNDGKESYWGWCLVTVRPESVEMEVFGTPKHPLSGNDFGFLKKFTLWKRK
jgi:hypothetical protein